MTCAEANLRHAGANRRKAIARCGWGLTVTHPSALLSLGCRPLAARDGREALYLLTRVRPSVLIVRLLLPELDGFQTVLRVRADPALRDLPILALAPEDGTLPGMELLCSGPTRVLRPPPGRLQEALEPELERLLGSPLAAVLASSGVR